ncbi:MAG: YncE family protein [Myxococcales bacterium]|nr:YncE family protein [Myxococcales bacterium]
MIDEAKAQRVSTIALPTSPDMYMPHNVQVAPDGMSVWVAAAPMTKGGVEKAFVLDPATGELLANIDLGPELHVAHVVLDSTSSRAYITANEASAVIEVDANERKVLRSIDLGADRGPHGMRFCGDRLWIANMTGKTLAELDPASGSVTETDVGGVAVQTACAPNGKYVFVSLYDTKEVIRYEIDTKKVTRIALPAGSQGPVQLYPSPDSKTLWVCDQGVLMGRPASDLLYAVDIEAAQVTGKAVVGQGAHGVVLSDDGGLAYVTNLAANTVSVVDTTKLETIATVGVGTKPNGISHWHGNGGMP